MLIIVQGILKISACEKISPHDPQLQNGPCSILRISVWPTAREFKSGLDFMQCYLSGQSCNICKKS